MEESRSVSFLEQENYATRKSRSSKNSKRFFSFSFDEIKAGTLVGVDKYGNKYFEDPTLFYGRNRWVEYTEHKNFEYDGSQIPAEWFGWMHYKV